MDDAALDRLLYDIKYTYDPATVLMRLRAVDRLCWQLHCARAYTRSPRRLRKCVQRRVCTHQQQERRRWFA
jgi:hypothetical protein